MTNLIKNLGGGDVGVNAGFLSRDVLLPSP